MQHIMRADARRRFTFGVTIENTTTRAWFCCRQAVLVSQRFNFLEVRVSFLNYIITYLALQEPLKWVKLVVPLTFGTAVDLGWDPTMQLKYDNQLYSDSDRQPSAEISLCEDPLRTFRRCYSRTRDSGLRGV